MADIYADEGITGTKVAVRQGFQRMIRLILSLQNQYPDFPEIQWIPFSM